MRSLVSMLFVFVATMTGCVRLQPSYLAGSDVKKAQILFDSGMIIQARQKAAQVPKDSPDYAAAKRLIGAADALASDLSLKFADMGRSYETAGLDKNALAQYELALEYNPADEAVKKKIALLSEKIRLSASKGGGFAPAEHYDRGKAALTRKAYFKAVQEFQLVTQYASGYRDARELLARALKEKKEAFERHLRMGIGYFEEDELELAIKEWDKALELEPDNKSALDYRIRAASVLKRLKKIRDNDTEGK